MIQPSNFNNKHNNNEPVKVYRDMQNYIKPLYDKYILNLDANKGTRMIKHNLTNNIPSYDIFEYNIEKLNSNQFTIINNYFIETVNINFPLIKIYDEYDYIKRIISDITDIYNLPIIPPIKFI
jgi:hypothetical protein